MFSKIFPILILFSLVSFKSIYSQKQKFVYGEELILKGKIKEIPFVNKIGKEQPKFKELYFKFKGGQYFIKFTTQSVKKEEIKKYINKTIKIRGSLMKGFWDTDNPEVQSRVGEYIIIYEIVEK